jgi:hypothetical protein
MEIYKDIEGFNGIYKISNYGNVISYSKYNKNGKILLSQKTKQGYLRVHLKRKHYSIHRLVAYCFLENPEGNKVVNHKDGNKQNNHVDNLEWVTQSENILHSFKNGMSKMNKGNDNVFSKNIIKQNIKTLETELIIGLREYCLKNKLDRRCIQRAINGEYKTAYGFKWSLAY